MCNRLVLNISLVVSILSNYNLLDCVSVDLSKRCYAPGMIGLTSHQNMFEVYEVSDIKTITTIMKTPHEDEACKQLLTCVGVNLD